MRKRFSIALAIVLLVVAVMLVWWSASRKIPDPVYQGKPLSVWLQVYGQPMAQFNNQAGIRDADTAVRKIGTNAIPLLLQMFRSKDSAPKLALMKFMQKYHLIKAGHETAADRVREAGLALRVLGPKASNTVPELIKICRKNASPETEHEIVFSLGHIGLAAGSAAPLLVQVLAGTNDMAKTTALWSLGELRSEPALVVPALEGFLHDTNSSRRLFAAQSLGYYGTNSRAATSGLLELVEDKDSQVNQAARRALGQIYAMPTWNPYVPTPFNRTSHVPDMQVRHQVLIGIINDFGAMGTNAAPAVPTLVKFLTHRDEQVRVSATNALKAIRAF